MRTKWVDKRLLLVIAVATAFAAALACGGAEEAKPATAPAPAAPAAPAVAAPAPAPAPAAPAPAVKVQPKKGGTVRIVPQGSLKTLDAQWTTLIVTAHIKRHMQEALVQPDAQFNIQPMLAEKWEASPDGLTWRVFLREGLKFHDGRPVTAADVVGSFKRVEDKAITWRLVRKTFGATMEALDDRVVVIRLKEPTGLVIDGLSSEQSFSPIIVPKEHYSLPQTESAQQAIGTGPFKFVSWAPGDRWIAERWDGYKTRAESTSSLAGDHTVYIDRMEWVEIPDMASRVAALETGQVEALDEFKADFIPRIRNNPNLNLFVNKPGNGTGIWLNQVRPPFNDIRVRRAVALAYPHEKALTASVGDPEFWRLCPIVVGCGTKWDTEAARANAAKYYNKRDVEGAKKLIKEAGFEGFKVRIMQPLDMPVLPDLAAVSAELFEELGFKVELQAMDWATLGTRRAEPDLWEAFHTWSGIGRVISPYNVSWIQKDGWFDKYQDTSGRMTQLYEQYARALTPEEGVKVFEQINTFMFEDVAAVPTGEFFPPLASRKEVKGWNPIPFPVFWGVWLEK